jgi:ATP-dependent DNA helicase PIF1
MNLSNEQKIAFEKFKNGENLTITGPGGTGKSKLIHHFVSHAICQSKSVQVTAMTGCAAILLGTAAKTIHSWSGIKTCRGTKQSIIMQAQKNKNARKNWRKTQILIIDEASMMSVKIFDTINELAQSIRNNPTPFGGIQVILVGDFYQLPPIESPDEPETGAFCFQSKKYFDAFPINNHVVLKTIFRQTDPQYIKILNEIRCGEVSEESASTLQTYLNRSYDESKYNGAALTKLFPIRARVDSTNQAMFSQLKHDTKSYALLKITDATTYQDSGKNIDIETLKACRELSATSIQSELQSLINNTPCNETLELKIGAAVMCNANVAMESGICNGTQGIVVDLLGEQKHPKVKFSNGFVMTMERHTWQSEQYPMIAISQYPLQLAWALTIHKIQGTTLQMAQMDIGKDIFAYGQTYVALSRIKSLDGLYLSSFMPERVKADPRVKQFYGMLLDADKLPEPKPIQSTLSVPKPAPKPAPKPNTKSINMFSNYELEAEPMVEEEKETSVKKINMSNNNLFRYFK